MVRRKVRFEKKIFYLNSKDLNTKVANCSRVRFHTSKFNIFQYITRKALMQSVKGRPASEDELVDI
jgi:hypothetical protein